MKHLLLVLAFLAPTVFAADIPCKVIGVSDGDTLTCLAAGKQQIKVRLSQIDAPEKDQQFGQQAKQTLSTAVFGKQVTLREETTDKYQRTVATVFADGRDVNLDQVKSGMAWVYKQYARDPAYFRAEVSARSARAGLWADADPIPPSEWRHGKKVAVTTTTVTAAPAASAGSCGAKRLCSQMTSCSEARHHLNVCGLSRLDRDGDGVPCESLCK